MDCEETDFDDLRSANFNDNLIYRNYPLSFLTLIEMRQTSYILANVRETRLNECNLFR